MKKISIIAVLFAICLFVFYSIEVDAAGADNKIESNFDVVASRFGREFATVLSEPQLKRIAYDPGYQIKSVVVRYDISYEDKSRTEKVFSYTYPVAIGSKSLFGNAPAEAVDIIENEHVTSAKRLSMVSGLTSYGYQTNTLICEWLQLPKVRSYDVIGVRFGNCNGLHIFNNEVNAYQEYDGNRIGYTYGGDHFNISEGGSSLGHAGIGCSMNLKDSAGSGLRCVLSLTFNSSTARYTNYGSYQHAVSNVSLTDSKKYSFRAGGLGNVFSFASGVASKYDGMSGVYAGPIN